MKATVRSRLARLRDLLLLVVVILGIAVATLLGAGLSWNYGLIDSLVGGWAEEIVALSTGLALLAGTGYVFVVPPCQADHDRRIKG